MRLSELLNQDQTGPKSAKLIAGEPDMEIQGITCDSRKVKPGFLFAALPGTETDGRLFIPDAVARGAVAILALNSDDRECKFKKLNERVRLVLAKNPRQFFAKIAARYFGNQPHTIVAVTGTNGKTTVAEFTRQLWSNFGLESASLGTLGLTTSDGLRTSALTTPDPVSLHSKLAGIFLSGINRVAIEASSHGIDQCRLDGVRIRAAAFTNFSQDHLDYHGSMENYIAAKIRLFSNVLMDGGTAVLNKDIKEFKKIVGVCHERGLNVITFGRSKGADLHIVNSNSIRSGQRVCLCVFGKKHQLSFPFLGDFQIMNALAAFGLVLGSGFDNQDLSLKPLEYLIGVPGRLQFIGSHPNGAPILVDYAHTPDALFTMLVALRSHVPGRLICIFGAGGDRDLEKRFLMGRTVAQKADVAIVTDDNPRSERPSEIRNSILKGCPDGLDIGNRADAIAFGISQLNEGDLLVVAGKGHEVGQEIGGEIVPFNDAEIIRSVLQEIRVG